MFSLNSVEFYDFNLDFVELLRSDQHSLLSDISIAYWMNKLKRVSRFQTSLISVH